MKPTTRSRWCWRCRASRRRTSKSRSRTTSSRVDGRIDFSKYKDMEPVYAEYNVGHFERSFTLSGEIDKEKISANSKTGC